MLDFGKLRDGLIGAAVKQLPWETLVDSALHLVNNRPKAEVEKATAEAFDGLPGHEQAGLMDGVLGALQSVGVMGKETREHTGGQAGTQAVEKASGVDFSKVIGMIQGNPELIKGILSSDLLKDEQVRAALMSLLGAVVKKLMR